MRLQIEIERETDGCFLAAIPELPGVMAYGGSGDEAVMRVKVLALRVIADEIEHRERSPEAADITFGFTG
jgi:predicted RNase H-like HicB family nuclease